MHNKTISEMLDYCIELIKSQCDSESEESVVSKARAVMIFISGKNLHNEVKMEDINIPYFQELLKKIYSNTLESELFKDSESTELQPTYDENGNRVYHIYEDRFHKQWIVKVYDYILKISNNLYNKIISVSNDNSLRQHSLKCLVISQNNLGKGKLNDICDDVLHEILEFLGNFGIYKILYNLEEVNLAAKLDNQLEEALM